MGQNLLHHPRFVCPTTSHRTLEPSQPFNTTSSSDGFKHASSFFPPFLPCQRETSCAKHLRMLCSGCQKSSPCMEVGPEWWPLIVLKGPEWLVGTTFQVWFVASSAGCSNSRGGGRRGQTPQSGQLWKLMTQLFGKTTTHSPGILNELFFQCDLVGQCVKNTPHLMLFSVSFNAFYKC